MGSKGSPTNTVCSFETWTVVFGFLILVLLGCDARKEPTATQGSVASNAPLQNGSSKTSNTISDNHAVNGLAPLRAQRKCSVRMPSIDNPSDRDSFTPRIEIRTVLEGPNYKNYEPAFAILFEAKCFWHNRLDPNLHAYAQDTWSCYINQLDVANLAHGLAVKMNSDEIGEKGDRSMVEVHAHELIIADLTSPAFAGRLSFSCPHAFTMLKGDSDTSGCVVTLESQVGATFNPPQEIRISGPCDGEYVVHDVYVQQK